MKGRVSYGPNRAGTAVTIQSIRGRSIRPFPRRSFVWGRRSGPTVGRSHRKSLLTGHALDAAAEIGGHGDIALAAVWAAAKPILGRIRGMGCLRLLRCCVRGANVAELSGILLVVDKENLAFWASGGPMMLCWRQADFS